MQHIKKELLNVLSAYLYDTISIRDHQLREQSRFIIEISYDDCAISTDSRYSRRSALNIRMTV